MAYTAPQIGVILLKADRTMYKIGQIAYENMFAEDNEALDYERDVIFIYKKAVEFADDFFVGTEKLDKVVERLATKISAYDYGELNPIYADAATVNIPSVVAGAALNDLTDVTIANLLDNQFLRYNAATGQWINVGPGSAVRSSQAFIATAGQTVFTTSAPFDAGLFDLYVNGVKLNSLSYTTMGEYQITLNDPCSAGDIVDVVIYDPNTGINPTANTLNDLTDVNIGPLANKQGLYYNSASGLWENGLVFVPYTGATAAVDLGEFEIRAGQFTLDTSPTGTATVGTTRWNDAIGSSETTLKGGSVILKNGVDLVARVVNKVTPNTTLTKASYAAVRISGAQGQRLAVAYAQANNDANSADTIGLVTETIATNQEGFIMTMGSLEGINTTGSLQGETWADGDVLYLSPTVPGRITNVKPTGATGHIVVVGYVEYAHANNGKIYVKTMNGWELDELHNVNINTGTLANGDVLKYNSTTQLWENGVSTAGISGSGASGQVTYWTGASAVSGSNNLFWDNAVGLLTVKSENSAAPVRGILNEQYNNGVQAAAMVFRKARGTIASPANVLASDLVGAFSFSARVGGAFTSDRALFGANMATSTGIGMYFIAGSTDGDYAPDLYIHPTGNVVVNGGGTIITGGVTDGGQRFQVYGDTLLRGSGSTSATTALTVQNSSSQNILRVLNNGEFRIGNASNYVLAFPYSTVYDTSDINGTNISIYPLNGSISLGGGTQAPTSSNANNVITKGRFQPTSGTATFADIRCEPLINQTGGANGITRGIYVNPTLIAAADWRSIQWDNNTGWGLYGEGTAVNYLGGRLTIGETTIGSNILNIRTNLVGSFSSAVRVGSLATSANTTLSAGFMSQLGTDAVAFTFPVITHFYARQGTRGAGSTITAQAGFTAEDNLTGAINNYGFFGNLPSGTGRWNLYMGGTADNYLAGNLGIGITPTVRLHVSGDTILRGSGNTNATTALTVQNSDGTNLIRAGNDNLVTVTNLSVSNTGGTTLSMPGSNNFFHDAISTGGKILFRGGGSRRMLFPGGASGLIINPTADNENNLSGEIKVSSRILNNANVIHASTTPNFTGPAVVATFSATGTVAFDPTNVLTGGHMNGLYIAESFAPNTTNKDINYTGVRISPTINQTGGAVAITRGLYIDPTLTAAADFRAIETSAGNVLFGASGTGFFWDNANGRLGIGTNAPAYPLHINYTNNSYAAGLFINNTNVGTQALSGIYLQVNGVLGGAMTYQPSNYILASQQSTVVFASSGNNKLAFIANSNQSGVAQDVYFLTFGSNSTRQLQIVGSSNNVIVNGTTDSTAHKFQVYGDTLLRGSGATSATTALTVQNSSSTNLFTVRNDGLVTISNGLLQSAIVTSSATSTRLAINNTNANPNAGIQLQTNAVGNWSLANYIPGGGTNASFVFYNDRTNTDSFFINGDTNNVGINTNNPTARLDVRGDTLLRGSGATSATTALRVQNSAGSSALTVDNGLTTIVHGDLQLVNTVVYWNGGNQIRNTSNGVLRICDSTGADFTRLQFGGTSTSFPALQRSGASICVMDATGAAGANLGVGTTTINASAILQADSTTKGFLPPRMTTTQKNAIATPAAGLVVYDTTDNKHYGYDGTTWNAFY